MDEIKSDLKIHIDYLSFTFPLKMEENESIIDAFDKIKPEIAELFYMDLTAYGELNDWAHNNYDYSISLGQFISIRFGGEATMMKEIISIEDNMKSHEKYESCMVELKGQACREIETLSDGKVDYVKIIEYFYIKKHGKPTRIDIAIDDTVGNILTIDDVIKYVKKGWYTSAFRSTPMLYTGVGTAEVEASEGKSLYFGKSNSNHKNALELCIYDKKAERRFNNDTYQGDYWTRFEIRFRDLRAFDLAFNMFNNKMDDIGQYACEKLAYILKLKHPYINGKKTDNKDVCRWDLFPAWEKFLNNIQASKFSLKPVMEYSIDKKMAWSSYSLTKQSIIFDLSQCYCDKYDDIFLDDILAKTYSNMLDMYGWFEDNLKCDRNGEIYYLSQREIEMINNYIRKNNPGNKDILISNTDVIKYKENLKERIEQFRKKYTLPF